MTWDSFCGVEYTPQLAIPLGSQCGPDAAGIDEYGSGPHGASAERQVVPGATWRGSVVRQRDPRRSDWRPRP